MSNIKISEMAEAESLNDNDLLTIVQSGINKKITKQNAIGDIIQAINNPTYTTTEGTDLSINNTRVGKMKFEYYGDTEQETTTGKNKLPSVNTTRTINGITFTHNEDGTITANGTATDNALYPIALDGTDTGQKTVNLVAGTYRVVDGIGDYTNYFTQMTNGSSFWLNTGATGTTGVSPTQTLQNTTSVSAFLYIRSGKTVNNITFKPMILLENVTDLSYEPYTGGIASPNPDYPQEVKTVTGDNTIDIVGKNEININNYLEAYPNGNTGEIISISDARCYWARVKPNETYTFSREKGDRLMILGSNEKPKIGNYMTLIVDDGNSTATSKSFTNGNFDYILIYSSRTSENRASWIMLEKGSIATPYEPYQSQSYELNLGKNLNFTPYKDGLTKTVSGITYTVNSNAELIANGTSTNYAYFYFHTADTTPYLNLPKGIYTLSGCPQGGGTASTNYCLALRLYNGTTSVTTFYDIGNGVTFDTSSYTYDRILLYAYIPNGMTCFNFTFRPMIEKGSQATSYAPYFDPIELCNIEEHPDYIHDNGGKWFKHKEIERIIITSAVRASGGTTGTNAYYISTNVTNGVNDNAKALAWSNMFNPVAYNNRNGAPDCVLLQNGGVTLRTRNNTTLDWSDNTKRDAWLNANLPIVYYALATPTEEEITEPTLINQLNAIKYGAESYYGQTNIMITSEELQPTLKVQTLDKIGV